MQRGFWCWRRLEIGPGGGDAGPRNRRHHRAVPAADIGEGACRRDDRADCGVGGLGFGRIGHVWEWVKSRLTGLRAEANRSRPEYLDERILMLVQSGDF